MKDNTIPNTFTLIKMPSDTPKNINDYRQQNEILLKQRFLYTSFDGIILANWENGNTEKPYIKIGSVVEFGGRLFEAKSDVYLANKLIGATTEKRYIRLVLNPYINAKPNTIGYTDNDYLTAEMTDIIVNYNTEQRGFYRVDYIGTSQENAVAIAAHKYLRVYFTEANGQFGQKKYWAIDDINRYGDSLKRNVVYYKNPGTFIFDFPLEAESVTIYVTSGGAGGGCYGSGNPQDATNSEILIDDNSVTGILKATATGGKRGTNAAGTSLNGSGGQGGVVTTTGLILTKQNNGQNGRSGADGGQGGIITQAGLATTGNGGQGNKASSGLPRGGGGGSGASFVVEVKRTQLGNSKKIKLTVGSRGLGQRNGKNIGGDGENGMIAIEYYTR